MPRRFLFLWMLFSLVTALRAQPTQPSVSTSGSDDDLARRVIIVANRSEPESVALAEYYAKKRGVPPENIIALKLSSAEGITWREFVNTLHQPLQDELVKRGWITGTASSRVDPLGRKRYALSGHRISYLVTCWGVPVKIWDDPSIVETQTQPGATRSVFATNAASVDSELALLARNSPLATTLVENPLFKNDRPTSLQREEIVKVSRLDGPTPADARRLVDNALAAEVMGLIGRAYIDIGGPHAQGDRWLDEAATQLKEAGFDVAVDREGGSMPTAARFDAPALYFGWYAWDVNGPFLLPEFTFPAGAVALHIHSFSADVVRTPTGKWLGPFVARGVTATVGNVNEPYLEFTHQPQLLVKSLLRGDTWGDALAYAIPCYSWQAMAVGDPLYRPFKISWDEQWEKRARLTPAQREQVVLRQMTRLALAERRDEAIWAGLELLKTEASLPVALRVAELQRAAGDESGEKRALAVVANRKVFSSMEWALAVSGATRLGELGDTKSAVEVWQRLLGDRALSRDLRILWLKPAIESARSAKAAKELNRWERELAELTAPPPTGSGAASAEKK